MTIIKAAAVQISPVLYSREGTVGKVVEKIIELGRQGVQFATFPETVVPYHPYFCFVQRPFEMGAQHLQLLEQAVPIPSATTHAIGEACKQAHIVVSIGVNERDRGTLYNTQLLFDADGTLLQHRRRFPRPIMSAWSGGRETVPGFGLSTAQSGESVSSHAGSITIRWPATH